MGYVVDDDWRDKLDAIWLRYQTDRNPETKQEFQTVLKEYADLILRGKRLRKP